jgi:hypothetical protein
MRGSNLFSLLIVLPLLVGCSEVDSLESASSSPGCGPEGCFNSDAATDAGASDVSTDIGNDAASESGSLVNPLCGFLQCDPDDFEATKCNGGNVDGGPPDGGGEADADPDVAQVETDADANADAYEDPDALAEGGSGSMGGSKDADEKVPYDQPDDSPSDDTDTPAFACQVTNDSSGELLAMCVPGGSGVDSDPCVTSADCSAGYACVGEKNAGVCRSYCCIDPEACEAGTYCGVLPSRDPVQADPEAQFFLPVCIPAVDCELLPGSGTTNRCADGLMCAIVRADGTTACVSPGVAGDGEPCEEVEPGQSPCAEGFVCSKATNTCLALCRVGTPDVCGEGACQGGTDGIPGEYGVCVGARD